MKIKVSTHTYMSKKYFLCRNTYNHNCRILKVGRECNKSNKEKVIATICVDTPAGVGISYYLNRWHGYWMTTVWRQILKLYKAEQKWWSMEGLQGKTQAKDEKNHSSLILRRSKEAKRKIFTK